MATSILLSPSPPFFHSKHRTTTTTSSPSRYRFLRLQLRAKAAPNDTYKYPSPDEDEPPEVSSDDSRRNFISYKGFKKSSPPSITKRTPHDKQQRMFSSIDEDDDEEDAEDSNPSIINGEDSDENGGGEDGESYEFNTRDEENDEEEDDTQQDFFSEVDRAVDLSRKKASIKDKKTKSKVISGGAVGSSVADAEDDDAVDVDVEEDDSEIQSVVGNDEFDLDLTALGLSSQLLEPTFHTTLAELLDDAKVVPVSMDGDLEVEITGIQHDSREVNPGDLFVCSTDIGSEGKLHLTEAFKRGAGAIIANKEIIVDDSIAVRALVTVEDTGAILPSLAASFYGNPSRKLTVIGITGSDGDTTTTYLLKSIYEAMGIKTGLLGSIAHYIQDNHQVESSYSTTDAVHLHKLMAKMVHNGTEACVMEASSHVLEQGRCENIDFDIAVFLNLNKDHMSIYKTEEEYKEIIGKPFERMIDPERQRKIVNIDDPNSSFFILKGNRKVPVISFSMNNKNADIYVLELRLSLFETQVLVKTPKGALEISSGLLGRPNVYNILAAVAVGIAVGAPLDDIVNGIEEVDTVSGRCELIDEEQPFAVIVDHARTPDALSRLLDTVRECGAKRLITVFGCEGDRERGKRPVMTKTATDKSEICVLTSDNPRTEDPLDIIDDMLAGVGWTMQDYLKWGDEDHYPSLSNGHRIFVYDIRAIALRIGIAMGQPGDAVVIAGKGHEKYQMTGTDKKSYDDVEECREALQYIDSIHAAGIDTSELPWRGLRIEASVH